MRFSTGGVDNYAPCSANSLSFCKQNGRDFRAWYQFGGHTPVTNWEDGDVWGSDFRDGASNDGELSGGSELPDIYYYSGHGTCQSAPTATDPDFISVCGNAGAPNRTNIGSTTRWGNNASSLNFAFLDASCPMDLVSIGANWFNVFLGLHIAIGHSGTKTQDTLDSADRASQFAALTAGLPWPFPTLSIGDAWMQAGIIDIESGCCAVAIANGRDIPEADRRVDFERVNSGWSDPVGNWFVWKWVCIS